MYILVKDVNKRISKLMEVLDIPNFCSEVTMDKDMVDFKFEPSTNTDFFFRVIFNKNHIDTRLFNKNKFITKETSIWRQGGSERVQNKLDFIKMKWREDNVLNE